jgi:putative membrane protein insertion efficiency factor
MTYLIILIIKLYRSTLSRILPRACRFTPSCSQYAIDAMKNHGLLKGLALSIYRILRCQPLCSGGWDPVPPRGTRFVDALRYKNLCIGSEHE